VLLLISTLILWRCAAK